MYIASARRPHLLDSVPRPPGIGIGESLARRALAGIGCPPVVYLSYFAGRLIGGWVFWWDDTGQCGSSRHAHTWVVTDTGRAECVRWWDTPQLAVDRLTAAPAGSR